METSTHTPATAWIAVVALRLQQRWPSIDLTRLDDVALELWRDERLRSLPPHEAAARWLDPVHADRTQAPAAG